MIDTKKNRLKNEYYDIPDSYYNQKAYQKFSYAQKLKFRFKTFIKKIIGHFGYTIKKISNQSDKLPLYSQDGLRTKHNHDFMLDSDFCKAYERGMFMQEGGAMRRGVHWRVHIALWTAYSASKLKGDFVECGVNKGITSSAIMQYLNWDSLNKTFYLMDTFSGIDERYVTTDEVVNGILERNKEIIKQGGYTTNLGAVKENFSQWKNTTIIVGSIPETLKKAETDNIAYLHLDMNCVPPEVAAFNYFWERLVPGGFVLLDDYAYKNRKLQYVAMNDAAAAKNMKIASLPTGQGLLIKPV